MIKLEMAVPVDGRRRFRGLLLGAEGDAARIRRSDAAPGESEEVLLPIEEMLEAKLVLTDALIAKSLKRGKSAERRTRQEGEEGSMQIRRAAGGTRRHAHDDKGE
jgi:ribosome maturation factor RimP